MIKRYFKTALTATNWFAVFIIFFCLNLGAATPFELANESYAKNDFSSAIASYEQILESGEYSAELYSNLGNAYFKNKQLGKAILNYERAKKLNPSDKAIQSNLSYANDLKKDEIETLPPFFVTHFFGTIRDTFSLTGWAIFTLFFIWLSMFLLILEISGKLAVKRKFLYFVAIPSIVLGILGVTFGLFKSNHNNTFKEAILIEKTIDLKEASEANSPNLIRLHEGTKIEILDKINDYFKVRLADGDQGCIQENALEII